MIEVTGEEILRLKTKLPPIQEALNKFNNPLTREFVREALEKAPDRFWLDPCTKSEEYHPPFDRVVPGGIINHALVCTYFVERGIQRYPEFAYQEMHPDHHWPITKPDPRWLDLARVAAMLHDIVKCGIPWGKHTVKNHGHLGAEFLSTLPTFQLLDPDDQSWILVGVRWHMGRWEEGFEQLSSLHWGNGLDALEEWGGFSPFELLIQEVDYYSTRTQVRVAGFELINYECDEA